MSHYIIRATHHYYGPSSKTSTVQANDGWDAEFTTHAAAKSRIADLEDGIYRLDQNEACSPTYRVRKIH